jgi:hypothetical protein
MFQSAPLIVWFHPLLVLTMAISNMMIQDELSKQVAITTLPKQHIHTKEIK